jgi:CRISPR-associated protein Csb1
MPEQPKQPDELTLDNLKNAVRTAAAFRLRVKLNGTGGDGDKVFPPTYAGGIYAVEDRRIDGRVVRCALLDSVQSQANRMEEALLDAFLPSWRELDASPKEEIPSDLPVLALHVDKHGWVTSLTAPHRVHDAIIRDSEIEETANGKKQKVRFRESTIGKDIVAARLYNAAALYKYCPTALIFGTWDSTAGEGLDSAKVPRAVVSEITGVDITPGVRTGSRIDPLGIRAQSATVYRLKDREDDWTLDDAQAAETDKGEKKKFGKGKPSDINHGNVTPDMPRFDQQEIRRQNLARLPDILETTPLELRYELSAGDGRIQNHGIFRSDDVRIRPGAVKPGGVTMAYALHTWILSLTQLRRLRFPISPRGESGKDKPQNATPDQSNEAGRTVLAALALYALALQQEKGYWLRSRCELVPEDSLTLEQVGGSAGTFSLGPAKNIRSILDKAIQEAQGVGLEWSKCVTLLTPTEKLQELVRRSDARGPESEEGEESANAGAAS